MATQVQNRRGTTAEHSTFTGANGELTVDTTKRTLVVHDGATAGGRPLLREDQSNLPTSAPTTGIYNASGSLAISTNGTKRIEIQADGDIDIDNGGVFYDATNNRLAIGSTASPAGGSIRTVIDGASGGGLELVYNNNGGGALIPSSGGGLQFYTHTGAVGSESYSERARIDSSGRLLVGTSDGSGGVSKLVVQGASNGSAVGVAQISYNGLASAGLGAGTDIGYLRFTDQGSNSGVFAQITATADATSGANDYPGRLVFSTTADGANSPTERFRVTSAGDLLFGTTSTAPNNSSTETGIVLNRSFSGNGFLGISRGSEGGLAVNRTIDDGTLVYLQQAGTVEGTISVSGTTVSYNGAHLSRWSQLPSGQERTEILRGSVLSNIDEMCEWGDEDNEQLNRMKVSDVEGDKNVSGVFQAWDDDDDNYTNDFYCAMTGDFIIRIGAGVTVERGDLLMSAGDGTAKPQDDDIIRSKTIAKVTSTNVSCTYDDGSYCVPCVLMAC